MSPTQLFSLSNELLIEIISNLRPLDIHACQCACRRLNKVIVDSLLIQYIFRTALSSIEPIEPDMSLPDRLDALDRWETVWREMDLRKPIASIDLPGRDTLLSEQHVIACHTEPRGSETVSYSFLDLHTWSSSPTGDMGWTTIDIQNSNALSFAFAPELNLSVTFSSTARPKCTAVRISVMSFNTGKPHPLALRPTMELVLPHSAIHNLSESMVLGDYVLYWVGDPMRPETHEKSTLCDIYIVAWKEGWVSELHHSLPGVYGPELYVLSEDIILLIRLREPALELCRLANIGDCGRASLEMVCILSLPTLTSRACLRWVGTTEEKPDHALFSKRRQRQRHLSPQSFLSMTTTDTGSSTWQPKGNVGTRYRRLRSFPSDGVVNLVMQFDTLSGYDHIIDFVVRRRTLLEFTNPQTRVGATGVTGMGLGTIPVLPWETWGPTNSRILDHNEFPLSKLSGERRGAAAMMSRITMRDYNPYRVHRALALLDGAGMEVTLACGSVVKVVKEPSVYHEIRDGKFCNDIETSLPYVETVTSYEGCRDIFMDENYLVVEASTRATEYKRRLYLHSL